MRRKDEDGVSPVIATILMVAITVVLAAVLYVMVTNIITTPPERKPSVVLGILDCDANACEGRVTTAQPATALTQFRVTVTVDGAPVIAPTTLAANTNITGGGMTFRYTDIGGEGKMTGGDSFTLNGLAPDVTYEVSFLWRDGTVVESIAFPA